MIPKIAAASRRRCRRDLLALGTCLAALLAGLPAVHPAAATVAGLDLLGKVGSFGGEIHTYQAVPPPAGRPAQVQDLAARLGRAAGVAFTGEARKIADTRTAIQGTGDPSASSEYDARTGAFLINPGFARLRDEAATAGLPDARSAATLAASQIAKLGLGASASEMKLLHVGGVNMGIPDGAGGTRVFEKLRTVRFGRLIDGLPVVGDTRIVAHLGRSGELAGIVYQWPELKRGPAVQGAELETPDRIRAQARARIDAAAAAAVSASLSKVDLVLYDDGRGTVEPAYRFELERQFAFVGRPAARVPCDFLLPALKESRAAYPLERAPTMPGAGVDQGKLPGPGDEAGTRAAR